MKFSYEDADEIKRILGEFENSQIKSVESFQESIIAIAQKNNYKKLIEALTGMIDVYNESICGELHEKLLDKWVNDGESLVRYSEDMGVGSESEEIALSIQNTLEELFSEKKNFINEYKYIDVAAAGEEDFDLVQQEIQKFENSVSETSDYYVKLFEIAAEDNFLYHLLLTYIDSMSVAFTSFIVESKKRFDFLKDCFTEVMASQLAKTTERKDEKVDEDPFEDLDLFMGSSGTTGLRRAMANIENLKSEVGPERLTLKDAKLSSTDIMDTDEYIDTGDFIVAGGNKDTEDIDEKTVCDKLNVIEKILCNFITESEKIMIDVLNSLKSTAIDTKDIFEVYSRYREKLSAISHLDYVQLSKLKGKKTNSQNYQTNNVCLEIVDRVRDNFNAFCANPGVTYVEKHRYSQLIKSLYMSNTGEVKKGIVNIDDCVRMQVELSNDVSNQLFDICVFDPVLDNYVYDLYDIVTEIIQKYYDEITDLSRGKTADFHNFLKSTRLCNAISGEIHKDEEKKSSIGVGEDAMLQGHFLNSNKKLLGLKANCKYFHKVAGHSGNYKKGTVTYYNYETDEKGRIVHAYTEQLLKGDKEIRDIPTQSRVGHLGDERRAEVCKFEQFKDDGGHIFGTQFGGSAYNDNMLPQHESINRIASKPEKGWKRDKSDPTKCVFYYRGGQWYRLEKLWKNYLEDKNVDTVAVDIKIEYNDGNNSIRPDYYHVITHIYYMDGTSAYKDFGIKNNVIISLTHHQTKNFV